MVIEFFSEQQLELTDLVRVSDFVDEYKRCCVYQLVFWLMNNNEMIDTNRDGKFTQKELVGYMKHFVGEYAEMYIDMFVKEVDFDGDGTVDMRQVQTWYTQKHHEVKQSLSEVKKRRRASACFC